VADACPPTASRAPPSWAERAFGLDTRSLAAFRAAVGAIVAADATLRTRDLALLFAPQGAIPPDVLRAWQGDPCCWSLATLVDAAWCGPAVLLLEGAAGVALTAGWHTRWATVAAWLAVVSVLRRTAPATNAGDAWLACLLFWGMFLPLGAAWSWDARRPAARIAATDREGASPTPTRAAGGLPATVRATVIGPPTVALVLQIAVVYVAAGLAKCNDSWLSGDAIRFAVSVHDHGTPLGERLLGAGPLTRPLSWGLVALELAGPLLLIARPGLRGPLAAAFVTFHAVSCLTLSIGLFGYVGMAAWMPLLPSGTWGRGAAGPPPVLAWGRSWPVTVACLAAGAVSVASLAHDLGPARERPEPAPLRQLANLGCLQQRWRMFGTVERQDQWAYARAELADGRVVDLLRGGRPLEAERPSGGFTSLPHHRWHKLLWNLPRPEHRVFAAPLTAALAEDWNRRHPATARVVAVELRFARRGRTADDDTLHELLLAAWPPRSPAGRGNLDRLLDAGGDDATARAAAARGTTVDWP